MARKRDTLLVVFRVLAFLLSSVALAIGVYITYETYALSGSAHDLEDSIQELQDNPGQLASITKEVGLDEGDVKAALDVLSDVVDPVLHFLQGTPARAIIIAVVGLFSLLQIIYLHYVHHYKKHTAMNRRLWRVLLEVLTLILWMASIICAILLALQYGSIALSGGIAAKAAMAATRKVFQRFLEKTARAAEGKESKINQILDIVGEMGTIGILAICSVIASAVCLLVSFVSLIVAFCTKAEDRRVTGITENTYPVGPTTPGATPMLTGNDEKSPTAGANEMSQPWSPHNVSANPYQVHAQGYNGGQGV